MYNSIDEIEFDEFPFQKVLLLHWVDFHQVGLFSHGNINGPTIFLSIFPIHGGFEIEPKATHFEVGSIYPILWASILTIYWPRKYSDQR